jgi:hypothetical protein
MGGGSPVPSAPTPVAAAGPNAGYGQAYSAAPAAEVGGAVATPIAEIGSSVATPLAETALADTALATGAETLAADAAGGALVEGGLTSALGAGGAGVAATMPQLALALAAAQWAGL